MGKYFDKIPQLLYNIDGKQLSTYQTATNIFFRVRVIRNVLENVSAYYDYLVKDDDTPEILAEKVYGDSEAHWIILLSNQIIDPQYDWPLNESDFSEYIIGKYGSISNSKTSIHHYEKVITRENSIAGMATESRFIINQTKLTANDMDVPYDTYTTLPETQEVDTYNLDDNETVIQVIRRDAISCYDYEYDINEKRRAIKIIKPEYYGQIIREFNTLTGLNERTPYIRRLV
jgi:hypothetical protein